MKAQPDEARHRAAGPDRRLRRAQRLIRSTHFQEAFDQNHSAVGRYMVVRTRQGNDAALRIGLIASRKVGNAVERSRARRKLREAWRINRHRLGREVDVVIVARRAIVTAAHSEVETELLRLLSKLGVPIDEREDA